MHPRFIWALLAALLLLAACGGSTPNAAPAADSAATNAPTTQTPAASSTSEPPGVTPQAASDTSLSEAAPKPTATTAPAPSPTPFPTATPVPPTPTPVPRNCIAELPLRAALGQFLMPLAVPGDYVSVATLASNNQLGGVALLGNPSVEQLAVLRASDLGNPLPIMIASDEEGGRVQRLGPALGALPSAFNLTNQSVEQVQQTFADYGVRASAAGMDMAFGPVLDVGAGPAIGDRSFSSDPSVVTSYGQAVIAGWQTAGVIPVVKHFPGHGKASADTHTAFASVPHIDSLRNDDLLPFAALVNQPGVAVMIAHVTVPGLSEERPASLSPEVIDGLLRTELGFTGVVITDALDMQAIAASWDAANATELALLAGADIAIIPGVQSVDFVLNHLEEAVANGRISRARVDLSVQRILTLRGLDPCTVADQFAG